MATGPHDDILRHLRGKNKYVHSNAVANVPRNPPPVQRRSRYNRGAQKLKLATGQPIMKKTVAVVPVGPATNPIQMANVSAIRRALSATDTETQTAQRSPPEIRSIESTTGVPKEPPSSTLTMDNLAPGIRASIEDDDDTFNQALFGYLADPMPDSEKKSTNHNSTNHNSSDKQEAELDAEFLSAFDPSSIDCTIPSQRKGQTWEDPDFERMAAGLHQIFEDPLLKKLTGKMLYAKLKELMNTDRTSDSIKRNLNKFCSEQKGHALYGVLCDFKARIEGVRLENAATSSSVYTLFP